MVKYSNIIYICMYNGLDYIEIPNLICTKAQGEFEYLLMTKPFIGCNEKGKIVVILKTFKKQKWPYKNPKWKWLLKN